MHRLAASIGHMARAVLSQERAAKLMGTTSRGLFLQTSSPWLVFLSFERFRGPLTVNAPCGLPGDPCLEPGRLRFGRDVLEWENAPTWHPPAPPPRTPGLAERIEALPPTPEVAGPLEEMLGRGPGLTPSGDDVVLGLLLAEARWGLARHEHLVAEAHRRTTTLSANLIALAARGDADERLVELVDWVTAGGPVPTEFLRWGAHSGEAVLQGVRLAFAMHG